MTLTKLGFTCAAAAILLTACATTTQMTSGADYLARYKPTISTAFSSDNDTDAQVRSIAAIEPDLRFPARIGLARIQGGQLTTAPEDEMQAWSELADNLGAPYGEFVPVSPFIAAMVRPNNNGDTDKRNSYRLDAVQSTKVIVGDIRRASARQHLDYVLVYEVNQNVFKKAMPSPSLI